MDFIGMTALQQNGQKGAEWIMLNFSHHVNPKVALQDQNQDENYKSFFSSFHAQFKSSFNCLTSNEVLSMPFFKYPMYKT